MKTANTRKRAIIGNDQTTNARPIRTEARSRILKGIAKGRRWLDLLQAHSRCSVEILAAQHKLSTKTVRSTLSLAFLAPDIVQAAIEGRLPRGLGVSRMTDLPPDWSEQRRQLGIG